MKRLFSFNAKGECPTLLVIISKIVKVIHIIMACIAALAIMIIAIDMADFSGLYLLLGVINAALAFFMILFVGFVLEILFLSLSIITRKNYEDLLEKGKTEDVPLPKDKKKDNLNEKLDLLGELKSKGIITEEEFNEKKKELLQNL